MSLKRMSNEVYRTGEDMGDLFFMTEQKDRSLDHPVAALNRLASQLVADGSIYKKPQTVADELSHRFGVMRLYIDTIPFLKEPRNAI